MVIGNFYQSKGYGQKALKAIECYVRQLDGFDKIVADFVVGNDSMKALLEKEDFIKSGKQEEWNEIVMTKELKK